MLINHIECFTKVGRDISFARIFASSCWSDRAGNLAVVGCIQLDESQQDWVYGLGAVVFGYDVDRIKTLNSCYTYTLGAKRHRAFGVPCSILLGPPVPVHCVQHTTAGGTRRYPWARDCLRR